MESLQAQLGEQTKLAKEQLEALMEDRRVKDEEYETRRQRDEEKIKTLTEKLALFCLLGFFITIMFQILNSSSIV